MKQLNCFFLLIYSIVSLHSMESQKSITPYQSSHLSIQKLKQDCEYLKTFLSNTHCRLLSSHYHNSLTQKHYIILYAYDQSYDQLTSLANSHNFSLPLNNKKYSVLGIAALTPHKIPFSEQKEFMQKLLILGYTPTCSDKDIAFIKKWEKTPWNKMALFHYANQDQNNCILRLPTELTQFIALLIFSAEESLF
ncbi:MAG TPA: hypothetical protein VLB80_04645 [Candidatus Babeliales bacterium]|nr:hypothetical protein [Candidatus Babeliales bacterium]